MLRKIRILLIAFGFAVLGAVAGRIAADLRRRHEQGEPLEVTREAAIPRPQEVVPGLVAALRVSDRPWSVLHIPSWLAAFAVNFAFSALGRELRPFGRSPSGEDRAAGPSWTRDPATETRTVDVPPVDGEEPAEVSIAAAEPPGNGSTEGFAPFRD